MHRDKTSWVFSLRKSSRDVKAGLYLPFFYAIFPFAFDVGSLNLLLSVPATCKASRHGLEMHEYGLSLGGGSLLEIPYPCPEWWHAKVSETFPTSTL
jgi:hypothetical protein